MSEKALAFFLECCGFNTPILFCGSLPFGLLLIRNTVLSPLSWSLHSYMYIFNYKVKSRWSHLLEDMKYLSFFSFITPSCSSSFIPLPPPGFPWCMCVCVLYLIDICNTYFYELVTFQLMTIFKFIQFCDRKRHSFILHDWRKLSWGFSRSLHLLMGISVVPLLAAVDSDLEDMGVQASMVRILRIFSTHTQEWSSWDVVGAHWREAGLQVEKGGKS